MKIIENQSVQDAMPAFIAQYEMIRTALAVRAGARSLGGKPLPESIKTPACDDGVRTVPTDEAWPVLEHLAKLPKAGVHLEQNNFPDGCLFVARPSFFRDDPYIKAIHLPDDPDNDGMYAGYAEYERLTAIAIEPMAHASNGLPIPQIAMPSAPFLMPVVRTNPGKRRIDRIEPGVMACLKAEAGKLRGKAFIAGPVQMGYAAYIAAIQKDISSIDIIDNDRDRLAFVERHIIPKFPDAVKIQTLCHPDPYAWLAEAASMNYDSGLVTGMNQLPSPWSAFEKTMYATAFFPEETRPFIAEYETLMARLSAYMGAFVLSKIDGGTLSRKQRKTKRAETSPKPMKILETLTDGLTLDTGEALLNNLLPGTIERLVEERMQVINAPAKPSVTIPETSELPAVPDGPFRNRGHANRRLEISGEMSEIETVLDIIMSLTGWKKRFDYRDKPLHMAIRTTKDWYFVGYGRYSDESKSSLGSAWTEASYGYDPKDIAHDIKSWLRAQPMPENPYEAMTGHVEKGFLCRTAWGEHSAGAGILPDQPWRAIVAFKPYPLWTPEEPKGGTA